MFRSMVGCGAAFGLLVVGSPRVCAAEPEPVPSVTVASPPGGAAPAPAAPPPVTAARASDSDAPMRSVPVPSTLTSTTSRGGDGPLVAAEIVVGGLVMSAIGISSYYAVDYQPTYETIPRSTTASNVLNVTGLIGILGAPVLTARLICGIGRWSTEYEGSCGWAIGLAYLGLLAPSFTWLATAGKQPPNCYDCAIPGPSVPAVLTAYIVGVTTGAVLGWNLSKHRKDEALSLQPIFRAGPPPATLAEWTELLPRAPTNGSIGVTWAAIAFAF
jgi:hypothetical protein